MDYLIRVNVTNNYKVQYRRAERWHLLDYCENEEQANFIANSFREDTGRVVRVIKLKEPKITSKLI